jgi:hypothetical protein
MSASQNHWKTIQTQFLTAVAGSFVLLQLLFLANLSYLYGTQFQSTTRTHNFDVLLVDYDGGLVGKSVAGAYEALKGSNFITMDQGSTDHYATTEHVRQAVCKGHYWAAVYTSGNASARLSAALGSDAAATNYSNSEAIYYVWNEARYPAESEADILASIEELVIASRTVYYELNGTSVAKSANISDARILGVFLDPIESTGINLQPTAQGPRVLYNTVTMVMSIIQQFFFLMALNGVSASFKLFIIMGPRWNGIFRAGISAAYTFLASLCTTGYIWAFREDWSVNGNQFALTWVVFWFYMHINFLVIDVATVYVPMQFLPFFVLTWAIINVASTITPYELNPGFFRWGYALPSHEAYQLLVQIWSGGCARQDYRALPIMFTWWIVGIVVVMISMHHRCKVSVMAQTMLDKDNDNSTTSEPPIPSEGDAGATNGEPNRPDTNSSTGPLMNRRRASSVSQAQALELVRLDREAYGPSYPTPFVHGVAPRQTL